MHEYYVSVEYHGFTSTHRPQYLVSRALFRPFLEDTFGAPQSNRALHAGDDATKSFSSPSLGLKVNTCSAICTRFRSSPPHGEIYE